MVTIGVIAAVLLGFTWFGYPALMRVLAAMRERKVAMGQIEERPRIAVLVASRDAPDAIAARVANLRDTDWPSEQLAVYVALDLGSMAGGPHGPAAADFLSAVAAAVGEGATVVRGGSPGGKASALNAGMTAISEATVVLTDTHQRFDRRTIPELVAALDADERLGAVSGALRTREPTERPTLADHYWSYEKRLRYDEAAVHSTVGVTGAVYAVRRALYPSLPAGLILDDLFVPMSIVLRGRRVGFTERAIASDTRRFSTEQEYRRKVRTLTGVWQLCAWLPQVLLPGRNPIWIQFVSHKLLRLLTPYLAVICAVAMGWVVLPLIHAVHPLVLPLGAAVGAAILVAPGVGQRVRNVLHTIGAMQAAIVVASVNAVRGRWAVWR
jgi:cellulose synthase/poly-beta-1,6-N-acetylglucosamine synthase-like glycosyltransferase